MVPSNVQEPLFRVNHRDGDRRELCSNIVLVSLLLALSRCLLSSSASLRLVLIHLFKKQPVTVLRVCFVWILEYIDFEFWPMFKLVFLLLYRINFHKQQKNKVMKQYPRRIHLSSAHDVIYFLRWKTCRHSKIYHATVGWFYYKLVLRQMPSKKYPNFNPWLEMVLLY